MERRRRRRVQLAVVLPKYEQARLSLFSLRYGLSLKYKILLAFSFAGLTGLSAQAYLPIPFTPVPVTLQVFTVLLAGVLLGRWFGGFSQSIYLALGVAGIPWFAGLRGGVGVLAGVTGGYLIGLVVTALIVGWFTERYVRVRYFPNLLLLMLVCVLVIYALGALWLSFVLRIDFLTTMMLGVIPFIPGDVAKAVSAAVLAATLCPKQAYDGEVDMGKILSRRKERLVSLSLVLALALVIPMYFWLSYVVGITKPAYFEFATQTALYSIGLIVCGTLFVEYLRKRVR